MEQLSFGQRLQRDIFNQFKGNIYIRQSVSPCTDIIEIIDEIKNKNIAYYKKLIKECSPENARGGYIDFLQYHIDEYERVAEILKKELK
jgi:hypothetical protein